MRKKIFLTLLVGFIAVGVLSGCKGSDSSKNDDSSSKKSKSKATDFTLKDQYGKSHTLSKYKGKVVLLSFWTTWCGSCQEEIPEIEKLSKEYKGKDVVILSSTSPNNNNEVSEQKMNVFLKKKGITHPVVFDTTGEVWEKYRIRSIPTIYVINKKGEISTGFPGLVAKEELRNLIQKAAKE